MKNAFRLTLSIGLLLVFWVCNRIEDSQGGTPPYPPHMANRPETRYLHKHHAQNSFDDGLETFIVLAAVANGMPPLYGGQDADVHHSLAFFEKDLMEWKDHPHAALFKRLFQLKRENKALWNDHWGGEMVPVYSDQDPEVVSFYREKDGDAVLPVLNFSPEPLTVTLRAKAFAGRYADWFTGQAHTVGEGFTLTLPPWGYVVLVRAR